MEHSTGETGIAKNIFVGYFVLILHVLILALLVVFIIFFRGLVVYMPWILGGGLVLLILSGVWFYLRLKKGQRSLKETMSGNVPQNRPVEISLLGGLAAVRLGTSGNGSRQYGAESPLQLEDPETSRLRSLDRLMEMYNKELISKEEFALLKQDVLQDSGSARSVSDSKNNGEYDGVIDVDFTSIDDDIKK
ncbi:MAG: SHOCT domain-containing protein [Thermodesulfobacteriota bacterium]|nr:SHOCT domain-containing protein [Thermodesulfobacteriota bacterium]